ncbi:DUF2428 domain-containing protein [Chloropicon primus]|uniref:Uncharacterized protein n=4 Tax=Chloropicon primus TaxID=1764295 RepID=A0A5B8MR48_9CHLO|nr:hypothetical protein A3770_07p46230 [Chloropicon primus]UPR01323.1 DUF2428 domain-containing protein [Chloropicon primus]|eukprot:QDZ22105.1 hypothetical protein A3770_07p46230 [Chloropicon primus]
MTASRHNAQNQRRLLKEQGTHFTEDFVGRVAEAVAEATPRSESLAKELEEFCTIGNTYGERAALKTVWRKVEVLAREGDDGEATREQARRLVGLLGEMVFLENSRALHRQLLSSAAKLPAPYLGVWKGTLRRHIELACGKAAEFAGPGGVDPLGICKNVMRVSKGLMSMLCYRAYDDVLGSTSLLLVEAFGLALKHVCKHGNEGKIVAPLYVELCQETVNVLHSLVQMHHAKLETNRASCLAMLRACLDCLHSEVMPRDVMVAAAVTIWTYMFKDSVDPRLAALWAANSVFVERKEGGQGQGTRFVLEDGKDPSPGVSPVHELLRESKVSFEDEVASMNEFGTLCCLRGLLSVLPTASYGVVLGQSKGTGLSRWSVMMDGIIPLATRAVNGAGDSHTRYHALCILDVALRHWCQFLREKIDSGRAEAEEGDDVPCGIFDESDGESEAVVEDGRGACGTTEADEASARAGSESNQSQMQVVATKVMLELVDLLSSSWADPLPLIVRTSHLCFRTLVDVHELQCHLLAENMHVLNHDLCKQIFSMGFHKKGIYSPLTHLVNKVGSRELLVLSPSILTNTFETASEADDSTCTAAAGFMRVFLKKLYEETHSLSNWMDVWEVPLIEALQGRGSAMRENVAMYMLSLPLQIEPRSLHCLLASMLDGMKDSWSMEQVAALVAVLKTAKKLNLIGNIDHVVECPEGMRIEMNPKILESAVFSSQEVVRINMIELLCTSFKKVVLPGKAELELLKLAIPLNLTCTIQGFKGRFETLMRRFFERVHIAIRSIKHKHLSNERRRKARGVEAPDVPADEDRDHELEMIELTSAFLFWLRDFLVSCMYPGAPVARRGLALSLLRALLKVFLNPQKGVDGSIVSHDTFSPLQDGPMVRSGTIKTLISNVADSWDDIRDCSSDILCLLPSPLPGLSEEADVATVLEFAKGLLLSAQVRESDAGASLIRTIVKKYVMEMGWEVRIHPEVRVKKCDEVGGGRRKRGPYKSSKECEILESTLMLVQESLERAEQNLYKSCLNGLAHGGLLFARYLLEDFEKAGSLGSLKEKVEMAKGIFECVLKATKVSVWAVSQQDELNVQAAEAEGDISANSEEGDAIAPVARVIINGSWLTIKEVSLVTGRIAQILTKYQEGSRDNKVVIESHDLVKELGNNLIHILEKVKHNGSVEKAHLGLMSLARPLLADSNESLNTLPYKWLEQLKAFDTRPGQTGSDIVRRSAGLPFTLVALAKSEPKELPKKLLPMAMKNFMDIAMGKGETQEYIPRVHALNMLSKVFNDSELATDTSGFFVEGLKLAIVGFGDSHWEVRNGASQLYSTLIVRMVGFKNVWKIESSRRAITSSEFFDRFQVLHPFFMSELSTAVSELERRDEESQQIVPATLVHPSLLPILGVLSRLDCSLHNKYTASVDALSPRRLAPLVQRCCNAQSLALRNLAADSLAPLIAPDETPGMWLELVGNVVRIQEGEMTMGVRKPNVLHGTLRQLHILIKRNVKALGDKDLTAMLDAVLSSYDTLIGCSRWDRNPCPFVRSEAVSVMSLVVNFVLGEAAKSNSCPDDESKSLWTKVVAFVTESTGSFSSCQDGEYAWEAGIAKLAVALMKFGTMMGGEAPEPSLERMQGLAIDLLSSAHYEVRAATLKEIIRSWEALVPRGINPAILYGKVRKMLESEVNHKVMRRILAVLQRCSLMLDDQNQQLKEDFLQVAVICLSMSQTCTHEKLKSGALSCSGYYMCRVLRLKEISGEAATDDAFENALRSLIEVASDFCEPWQRIPLRVSAYSCLFGSGLTQELSSWLEARGMPTTQPMHLCNMRLWQVAIDMLQDDDKELRNSAGQLIGSILGKRDVQTTIVMSRCFEYLTNTYGSDKAYHEFLIDVIEGCFEATELSEENVSKKRLFELDEDNLHQERMVLLQLAFQQVDALVGGGGKSCDNTLVAYLKDWSLPQVPSLENCFDSNSFLACYVLLNRVLLGLQRGIVDGSDRRLDALRGVEGRKLPLLIQAMTGKIVGGEEQHCLVLI